MGGVNVILIVGLSPPPIPTRIANKLAQVEAIQEFITHSGSKLKTFHVPSIIAVGVALGGCSVVSRYIL